jgi:hypothetical protein
VISQAYKFKRTGRIIVLPVQRKIEEVEKENKEGVRSCHHRQPAKELAVVQMYNANEKEASLSVVLGA